MTDTRRIVPVIALAIFFACSEPPSEPPNELRGPSLSEVAVEPGDDLQAVIDGLPPGSTLVLEEGLYDLTAGGVVIDKRLTIEADGDAVILGPADGSAFTVEALEKGKVSFRDLRIQGEGDGIFALGNILVDECAFVDLGGIAIVAVAGSVSSIRESTFTQNLVGLLGAGDGTQLDAVDNTFTRMGIVGAQVQGGAVGHFEDNTFSDCNVLGIQIFTCIGFRSASGEAIGNTIDTTLRGIRVFQGEALLAENEITRFELVGIEAQNVITVSGSDNEIEDAAGGETDCDDDFDFPGEPPSGAVQVIDNEIQDGAGVGIIVRAEQFNIEETACVGP